MTLVKHSTLVFTLKFDFGIATIVFSYFLFLLFSININMIDIDLIYTTLDDAYGSENVLDILVEFERVFDQLDIYVYKNWQKGEIIEGPKIDRYWITVTLMYPYKMMPDPEGALRLIDHGCKVWFGKDMLKHVGKIELGADEHGREQDPDKRIVQSPVWLVKVTMPRHFVDEVQTDKADVNGKQVDMDDVSDAYDEDLNSTEAAKGNAAENEQETQQVPTGQ